MSSLARSQRHNIFLVNCSISCEPSNFLFNQILAFLRLNGYLFFHRDPDDCDTAIVNTCCVTQKTMAEADKIIEHLMKVPTIKEIIIFGCYAKISEKYNCKKSIILIGPKELSKFNKYFGHHIPIERAGREIEGRQLFVPYQKEITQDDCFVLIGQGCIHRCSYCNIKLAKGFVSSRKISIICSEIKARCKAGQYEFVLLSDDCGSYGRDLGVDLVKLVSEIFSINPRIRLKISSIFPGDLIAFYPKFKRFISAQRIAYINIPVQSGSDRILKLMNRKYKKIDVINLVKDIRIISPKTWLYTHFIINFPTETKADFMQSIELADCFDEVRFVPYSNNPLTLASRLKPQVNKMNQLKRIDMAKKFIQSKQIGTVAK